MKPEVALPKPKARWQDQVRVSAAALSALSRAAFRRVLGRPLNPNWPLKLELVVSASQGAWSVMPEIGMVRWREATEAMSPLRTDGLAPRFVELGAGENPGDEHPLYGAWLEPPDATGGVLLYFNGGGFVFGSLRTHGELIGALARATHARTFVPFYRLAPEHPLPAAVNDAVRAYRYLLDQGHAPSSIALGGDSAGGTLVLNTLIALRDAGLPMPGAAVAISPWVDLGCSGDSFEANARFDFVGREHCLLAAQHALGGADASKPEVSPLFASLHGLPPLLVHAGAKEVLVDQIRAFTARAQQAGCALTCAEYPDMVHVWHLQRAFTTEGERAIDEVGAFIQKHTGLLRSVA